MVCNRYGHSAEQSQNIKASLAVHGRVEQEAKIYQNLYFFSESSNQIIEKSQFRSCLRIVTILSFLQDQSNPVIIFCTSIGTLKTQTANSCFGILLMEPVCQNASKNGVKRILVPTCSWHYRSLYDKLLRGLALLMALIFRGSQLGLYVGVRIFPD